VYAWGVLLYELLTRVDAVFGEGTQAKRECWRFFAWCARKEPPAAEQQAFDGPPADAFGKPWHRAEDPEGLLRNHTSIGS